MGTPVPPEPFEIDPAKNYTATVRLWLLPHTESCENGLIEGTTTCARTGQQVIDWLDGGHECTYHPLCSPLGLFITERLIDLEEI